MTDETFAGRHRRWLAPLLLFAALWWALAEGAVLAPGWALLGVGTATFVAARYRTADGAGLSARGTARFAAFFLRRSVVGGLDVALRALHPRLPLRPGMRVLPVTLPPGAARYVAAAAWTLMPGTLSVALDGDRLHVHLLDTGLDADARFAELERHVGAMFVGAPRSTRSGEAG